MDARDAAQLTRHRRWLRPDWERWLRPDWERYVHPAQREAMHAEFAARKAALETPPCARQRLRDAQIEREQEWEKAWEAACAERKFRSDIAWLRFRLALIRRELNRKAGFNPDQPRDEQGRWSDGGGGINDSRVISDVIPDNEWKPGAQVVANNERRPPTLGHNRPPADIPPERPEKSNDRTSAVKGAIRLLAPLSSVAARASGLITLIQAARWLGDYRDEIRTSFDPPKSLQELQDAVDRPRPGTEVHHINEQAAARKAGDSEDLINGRDNLVRIPKRKHQDMSEFYQTKNRDLGILHHVNG